MSRLNGPPEFFGVLARALLKAPNHTLPLLPAGEAHIEAAGTMSRRRRASAKLNAVPDHRLGFQPAAIWLDAERRDRRLVSSWFSVVSAGLDKATFKR